MKNSKKFTVGILVLLSVGTIAQTDRGRMMPLPAADSLFHSAGVTGSFLLFDKTDSTYFTNNSARCTLGFSPASTFKVFNSLAAIDAGAVRDEKEIIKWDGVKRSNADWNADQDMKTAFRNSTVWFYQEIARRVGEERMRRFIERERYGNKEISGGIDKFWLNGGLRISQMEQIAFLNRLIDGNTGFSPRAVQILKTIMTRRSDDAVVYRAKTGWGMNGNNDIGWFTGWVERSGKIFIFALNIESNSPAKDFGEQRIIITEKILHAMGVLD